MSSPSLPEICAILAASQPIISVASAPRSSASRDGWLIAISTRSTSSASGDWKTLACDSSTLPTSSLASSRFSSLPCAWVRTSTAMSPGSSAWLPMVMRPLFAFGDETRDFGGGRQRRGLPGVGLGDGRAIRRWRQRPHLQIGTVQRRVGERLALPVARPDS